MARKVQSFGERSSYGGDRRGVRGWGERSAHKQCMPDRKMVRKVQRWRGGRSVNARPCVREYGEGEEVAVSIYQREHSNKEEGMAKQDHEEKHTHPELREEIKEEIKASEKGGEKGQWSARKSQLLTQEYEKRGGGYKGEKGQSQKNLEKWTEEEWQTKEGDADARQDDGETKRYLPKKAWEKMSDEEKEETEKKKREGSKEGEQYVSNTDEAKKARKGAAYPSTTTTTLALGRLRRRSRASQKATSKRF